MTQGKNFMKLLFTGRSPVFCFVSDFFFRFVCLSFFRSVLCCFSHSSSVKCLSFSNDSKCCMIYLFNWHFRVVSCSPFFTTGNLTLGAPFNYRFSHSFPNSRLISNFSPFRLSFLSISVRHLAI